MARRGGSAVIAHGLEGQVRGLLLAGHSFVVMACPLMLLDQLSEFVQRALLGALREGLACTEMYRLVTELTCAAGVVWFLEPPLDVCSCFGCWCSVRGLECFVQEILGCVQRTSCLDCRLSLYLARVEWLMSPSPQVTQYVAACLGHGEGCFLLAPPACFAPPRHWTAVCDSAFRGGRFLSTPPAHSSLACSCSLGGRFLSSPPTHLAASLASLCVCAHAFPVGGSCRPHLHVRWPSACAPASLVSGSCRPHLHHCCPRVCAPASLVGGSCRPHLHTHWPVALAPPFLVSGSCRPGLLLWSPCLWALASPVGGSCRPHLNIQWPLACAPSSLMGGSCRPRLLCWSPCLWAFASLVGGSCRPHLHIQWPLAFALSSLAGGSRRSSLRIRPARVCAFA